MEKYIQDALSKGGRVILGGKRHALGGSCFEPTILVDATLDMAVAREETFGPLAPLFRFRTEEEALRSANDTPFGLVTYLYTRDLARLGGIKESGLGPEGSKSGIEECMEVMYLCIGEVH